VVAAVGVDGFLVTELHRRRSYVCAVNSNSVNSTRAVMKVRPIARVSPKERGAYFYEFANDSKAPTLERVRCGIVRHATREHASKTCAHLPSMVRCMMLWRLGLEMSAMMAASIQPQNSYTVPTAIVGCRRISGRVRPPRAIATKQRLWVTNGGDETVHS